MGTSSMIDRTRKHTKMHCSYKNKLRLLSSKYPRMCLERVNNLFAVGSSSRSLGAENVELRRIDKINTTGRHARVKYL